MADFNIFDPKISEVVKGVDGKVMVLHSNERKLGKTLQATRFPQPYYLRFEAGINAISGIPYADLESWSDFKKVRKQLTSKKTLDQAKQLYKTLIIDTTDVAIKWCEKYVCAMQGVTRLNDGNGGFGLWKEYENEWFNEINALTNAGYFIIFIAHSEPRKFTDLKTNVEYEQLYPKGDKRTIDLILDLADFIGYVKSNGFDEDGNELLSSVYFGNCKEFLGGSRFKYMASEITPFTAENVQEAMVSAIEQEEKETGRKAITRDEKVQIETKVKYTYEEIMDKIQPLMKELWGTKPESVTEIVEEYLGQGVRVSETTKKQLPQLEMILVDLEELKEDE